MRKLSKLSAVILTITIAFCMTTVNPIFVNAVNTTIEQVGSCGGVQEKLNSIASVYPTGSYFTASGNVCYSNQSSDCQLSNIPSRGGLPSGATAANVTRDAWSCCAFARYVFYCTFGLAPESCGTVSSSNAQIGDYMNLGSHYAIYLGQDSTYWYVYDSNYTSPATNVVKYNRALRKSNFSSVQIHHASNYDTINNSSVNRTISIWGLENNHEILSATKLWAKRFDNDDNHYAVFYIDNQPITGHIQSDSSGYFSVNVDPHDYSQGVHVFKIFYANSTSSDTDEIYINIKYSISLWGLENNQEISSTTKLWAKRFDNDDNHYAVFYIDNQPITGHIQSDSSGYFSVNVDPHDYSQGVHAFKVFYANSTSSDTDEIYINIKYSISLWGLENNQEISSTTKLWAKRFDNDDNHYAVFYIDNQPITGHIQSDSSGYFSVNVDPHDYSQGVHAFKVFYANSTSSDTDIKNIYINYDSVQGDVNLDGVINISYATTVQKLLAQLIDFSDDQKAVADTNGDGIINISDATQIQKYLAQLIPSLG